MSYSSSEVATDSDVSHSPSTDELPIAAESIHRPTALPGHADTTESAEERLRDAIQSVEDAIAPVWPLKDYVAVNPFLGLSDRPFLNARRLLRSISDCEILMPIEFYQARFRQGAFGCVDVEDAVDEVSANSGIASVGSASLNAEHVFEALSARSFDELPTTKNSERHLRTISETVDLYGSSNWTEAIREEIGELCAAHYDDGEAAWSNPCARPLTNSKIPTRR